MKYLVDVNILSETTRPHPSVKVAAWLRLHEDQIAIDPMILGEIRFGILLLAPGSKRRMLEAWFADVVDAIQCIPWNAATSLRWAQLLADLRTTGRSMPIKDSLMAATALVHGLSIATRNVRDFSHAGVTAIDPFVEA